MNLVQLAAVGMQGDRLRTEVISQNLANALTPGFKSGTVVAPSFALAVTEGGLLFSGVGPSRTVINPSPGTFNITSLSGDVAVEGTQWLEFTGPEGPLYARSARLHVNRDGLLVGPGDRPVVGEHGQIRLGSSEFTINANGEVTQDGQAIDRLRRTQFERTDQFEPMGSGLYRAGNAAVGANRGSDPVRTGVLEASNVNSAQEMVRLSETVRHFESLQKVVQGYDDVLEKTIRKLGEF